MGDGYDAVWFYYNPSGSAMSFKYHDTRYYYIKNAQDDVTAIVDPNGNIVAKYEYDSWGKVLAVTDADGNAKTSSSHIGNINPLRYRSYFFDTESEFYYLNSRYYDTYTRRFINCDGYVSTGTGFIGYNMFAYCENNPVNYSDAQGSTPERVQSIKQSIANGDSDLNIVDLLKAMKTFEPTSSQILTGGKVIADFGAQGSVSIRLHALDTAQKPNNIGKGIYQKYIDDAIIKTNRFSKNFGRVSDSIGVIADMSIGICDNCNNGESIEKIAWDAGVDVATSVGSTVISSAVGTLAASGISTLAGTAVCPAVGTAVGFVIGIVLDYTILPPIEQKLKSCVR